MSASDVCSVRDNGFAFLLSWHCHCSIQLANARSKSGFWSPNTAAFPRLKLLLNCCLLLLIVHQTLISLMNSEASLHSGIYSSIPTAVEQSNVSNASGTLCLLSPGGRLLYAKRAFLKYNASCWSRSYTSCNSFHVIRPTTWHLKPGQMAVIQFVWVFLVSPYSICHIYLY